MRRLLAAALLAAALLGLAPAAHAQDDDGGFPSTPLEGVVDSIGDIADSADCRTPPTIRSPTVGAGYSIDPGPENPRPGGSGDPFEPNPTTTPYELFGYGGLDYQRYDPGCVLERLPGDVILSPDTMQANWKFGWAAQVVALSVASGELLRNPEPVRQAIDPLVIGTNDLLGEQVYYPLIGIAAVILGVWMLWKTRDAAVKNVPRMLGGGALVLVAASVFLNYPALALDKYWEVTGAVVNGVDELFSNENTEGADPGVVATADLHYNALVLPYMAGLVCSSSGPTFDQYASDLYRHSRFTFMEDRVNRGDPTGYGAELTAAKQSQWQAVADEIEQVDPVAYDCLQGELGSVQSQYGTAALALSAALGGTQTVANVLLNVAGLFGALLVAFFPAIAVIGIVRQDIAWSGFARVGKWLLKALVLFGLTRILTNLAGGMLERGVAPLIVAFIVVALVIAFIVWRIQRNKYVRRFGKESWKYIRGRKATEHGMEARDRDRERDEQQSQPTPVVTVEQMAPTPTEKTAWEGSPGTPIAGELPAGSTWVQSEPTGPRTAEEADQWTGTSVPEPEPLTPRVLDPGEQIPEGTAEASYQQVHRPAERTKTR